LSNDDDDDNLIIIIIITAKRDVDNSFFKNLFKDTRPITVAARSQVWVYGRLLAGFSGSNPAWGMDVCLL